MLINQNSIVDTKNVNASLIALKKQVDSFNQPIAILEKQIAILEKQIAILEKQIVNKQSVDLQISNALKDYKTITINISDYNFFVNILDNLPKSKTIESYLISIESTGTLQNHNLADGSLLVVINEVNNKSIYITTGDGYIYNYSYHHGIRYFSIINQSVYLQ